MQAPLLLLRADASANRGSGHLMRCLALAAAWQEGRGRAALATAECPAELAARVEAAGLEMHRLQGGPGSVAEARETAALSLRLGANALAADGYHFGTEWQVAARAEGTTLLVFDDYGHAPQWRADVILNQNAYARAEDYPGFGGRLLLGSRHVLLRPEFRKWRTWQRPAPAASGNLLLTLGGTDPDNVTGRLLGLLEPPSGWRLQVVVGASNPHRASLTARPGVELLHDPPDMAALLAGAQAAIIAGGGTAWEAAFLGLPCAVVRLAENQRAVAAALAEAGAALDLGDDIPAAAQAALELLRDPRRRAIMSERGRTLVDGGGAGRVVLALRSEAIRLRRANAADSRLIWEWANDPEVRARSFRSEPIPWEAHQRWWEALLANPKAALYLAGDSAGQWLGQVRFERFESEDTISVSLAPAARGFGYAAPLIEAGRRRWRAEFGSGPIHAFIKPDNHASTAAFLRAGFTRLPETEVRGLLALHFVHP